MVTKLDAIIPPNPAHWCLGCDKYIGHRGFCSKNCHDEWYDEEYKDETEKTKTNGRKN